MAQVATFLQGEAEILEFAIHDDSHCEGKTIAEIGVPDKALVGAIVRDGKPQIARGRSVLRDRDHVIVIALPESADRVSELFG